ncbi:MAG: hypothetical protein HY736_24035 [Verrucomicrobia bacterium]|nr:hypothetical protein [Verrucomicrobiota bacterium]
MTDQPAPVSKKMLWAGCVMSALPVLTLLMSADQDAPKSRRDVHQIVQLDIKTFQPAYQQQ